MSSINRAKGFTIIELVVSIVVIAILASIVALSYPGIRKRTQALQLNADLKSAATQLASDLQKNGKFPNTKEESGGGKGLVSSNGVTFQYFYIPNINGYCLSGTLEGQTLKIESRNKDSVSDGVCELPKKFAYSFGDTETVQFTDIEPLGDGTYIMIGSVDVDKLGADQDGYISRIDADGNIMWSKLWGYHSAGNDEFIRVSILNNKIFVAGITSSYGSGSDDFAVIRFDIDGNLLWNKVWGGSSFDYNPTISATPDGGCLLVGATMSFGEKGAMLRFDKDGGLLWSRTVDHPKHINIEEIRSVVVLPDGSFISNFNLKDKEDLFIKYTSNGDFAWSRATRSDSTYVVSGETIMSMLGDGSILAASSGFDIGGTDDSFLQFNKFSLSGDLIWSSSWRYSSSQIYIYPYEINQLNNGTITVGGLTLDYSGPEAVIGMYRSTIDNSGNLLSLMSNTESAYAVGLTQTPEGNYLAVGTTSSTADAKGYFASLDADFTLPGCTPLLCINRPIDSLTSTIGVTVASRSKYLFDFNSTEGTLVNPSGVVVSDITLSRNTIVAPN